MTDENVTKIRLAVAEVGLYLTGKLVPMKHLPSGRNAYAHIWKTIKDSCGKSYRDCDDSQVVDILRIIEQTRKDADV